MSTSTPSSEAWRSESLAQFVAEQDFFKLFDLPRGFAVDLGLLAERYLDIQKIVHPDRFADASDADRLLSVRCAAHINDALETLKSPVQRAIYLLSLQGVVVELENNTLMDGAFLMQQMEWREALAEVADSSDPEAALDALDVDINAQHKAHQQSFAELYAQGDAAHLAKAEACIHKMQFMHKLALEVARVEETLFD